jgi:hypothetical protein
MWTIYKTKQRNSDISLYRSSLIFSDILNVFNFSFESTVINQASTKYVFMKQ